MALVCFNVMCNAEYSSELNIPDEIADDREAVLDYIRDHLGECPVNDLDFVDDWDPYDAVDDDMIRSIDKDTPFSPPFGYTQDFRNLKYEELHLGDKVITDKWVVDCFDKYNNVVGVLHRKEPDISTIDYGEGMFLRMSNQNISKWIPREIESILEIKELF